VAAGTAVCTVGVPGFFTSGRMTLRNGEYSTASALIVFGV